MSEEEWQPLSPGLPALGILAGLSSQSLVNLAEYGFYKNYEPGDTVIAEGTMQNQLFIVVEGKLHISTMVTGNEVFLSEVEEGECLGEVSLLEPGPASATVRVGEKKAILWSMDAYALDKYLMDHPGGGGALAMGIAQCLSQRLRQANRVVEQHYASRGMAVPRFGMAPITAGASSNSKGFFGLFKSGEKKVKISTEIKL